MNAKDRQVLDKIAQHIESAIRYSSNCKDLQDFESDSMRVEACVFNLMQIGELAKQNLSNEAKDNLSNIPWKQIYGLRNRIVHGYSGVDMNIVWETIRYDLPSLLNELKNPRF